MTRFLHPAFLSDEREYKAVEALWQSKLAKFRRGQVEPYITNTFADGTSIRDGNPIASLVDWRIKRAARIVQEDPAEFGEYYTSFQETKKLARARPRSQVLVEEKVIVLTLTNVNLAKCLAELTQWFRP